MRGKGIGGILLAAALFLGACGSTAVTGQGEADSAAVQTVAENAASESESASEMQTETQEEKADWTVMVYLCGTDLESGGGMASANLDALKKAGASDRVNFIVQTGGASEWKTEGINPDKLQRFSVKGGEMTKLEELPLANMGDPETFGDFLAWGAKTYPAQKYMAVVWDHGGGPLSGAVSDELYNSIMTVPELVKGISEAGVQFEVIGFDACLMASLEIASALEPYGKYLVASEEVEPGNGWDYESLGQYLVDNPECEGSELGKVICDAFLEWNTGEDMGPELLTLSVTDLEKVPALVDAFGEAVLEMGDYIPNVSEYRNLVQEMNRAEKYYEGSYTVDLGDLVTKAESLSLETVKKVTDALTEAIVYKANGSSRLYSNGLSVLYTQGLSQVAFERYAQVCPSPEYLAYLDAVNYDWRAPDWVYEKTEKVTEPERNDYHVEMELSSEGEDGIQLHVTKGKDAVTKVVYKIFRFDTKENRAYCFGDAEEMDADWENGIFKERFDGKWAAIGGEYCYMHEVDDQEEYILYNIPVRVEGMDLILQAAYLYGENGEEGNYDIYGLWVMGETQEGLPSRNTIPLEDGMEITFLFPETDMSMTQAMQYREGSTIIYDSAATKMEKSQIKDGVYGMHYELKDVLGNTLISDPILITCEKGKITKETLMDLEEEEEP